MLRRQYHTKIVAFIGIILLLWLFIHNVQYVHVVRQIRWQFNSYFGLDEFKELESFQLPKFQNEDTNENWHKRPWYMSRGHIRPKKSTGNFSVSLLFPDPRKPYDDRIPEQLMYIPPDYGPDKSSKLILLYDYLGAWIPHEEGSKAFDGCPVDKCLLTTDKERLQEADAVLFDNSFAKPKKQKTSEQVWIIYMLESPLHTKEIPSKDQHLFNWTITYRPDSDLPSPYGGKWITHGLTQKNEKPIRNFAADKTKQVAWFASNCHAKNMRLQYAMELSKHIQVDIFGSCGDFRCPRSSEELCFKLLAKKYKFYLAFENSNCDYYITEKFFRNALRHNVIPVVMGARRSDYENVAPEGSFIHVDDFSSPEELANYLHQLDKDDELYNQYFLWRGTGEFVPDYLFCRLCSLLHSQYPKKYYKDINSWWRNNHVCSTNY